MKFTRDAIKLLKKFSEGVDCPDWDERYLGQRMFYQPCRNIAKGKKKDKIDKEVAKKYILEVHNPITVKNGIRLKSGIQEIKNCMVLAAMVDYEFVCVHGDVIVCLISNEEFETLKKRNEELLEGLQ